MLKLTCEADLLRLNPANPAYPIIEKFVQSIITDGKKSEFGYSPEDDGYLVLLDQYDIDRPLTEIWGLNRYSLIDVPWEGIFKDDTSEFFICIFLANNQWALTAILPDQDWLSGVLRECIESQLDE
jgi:hypothetical protein